MMIEHLGRMIEDHRSLSSRVSEIVKKVAKCRFHKRPAFSLESFTNEVTNRPCVIASFVDDFGEEIRIQFPLYWLDSSVEISDMDESEVVFMD